MENSLQETAGSFSLWGMKIKTYLAFTILPLLTFSASPAIAEECPGSICEVIFEYTGAAQYFDVPASAGNITFEIYGAAGGRGGLGGKISGELSAVPEELWIYVGGVGAVGSDATGGFNGGGRAGGSRGNEGSGGGASDIRVGTELSQRIALAGGAGGGGGYAGAPGGHGGNLIAPNGGSGQGGGGFGGTQERGGSSGSSNGGSAAESGAFGIGGTGGSSWNAGGGGGGGGWYGGGGGGADSDSCCSDAGGGGGGSSYADPTRATSVEHETGVRQGSGLVILRYALISKVTVFTAAQVGQSVHLEVGVQDSIALTEEDVFLADHDCTITDFTQTENGATFTVTGCALAEFEATFSEEFILTLDPEGINSIGLNLDFQGPSMFLTQSESEVIDYLLLVVPDESVYGLVLTDLIVRGCETAELLGLELYLDDCSDGEISVTLLPDSVADAFGNTGPSAELTFLSMRDTTAPNAHWLEPVVIEQDGFFSVVAVLEYEDSLNEESIVSFAAEDLNCLPEVTKGPNSIRFEIHDCAEGLLTWQFPAFSLSDAAGNLGPLTDTDLEVVLAITPAPEPEPEPGPSEQLESSESSQADVLPGNEAEPPLPSSPEEPQPSESESPASEPTENVTEELLEEIKDLLQTEVQTEESVSESLPTILEKGQQAPSVTEVLPVEAVTVTTDPLTDSNQVPKEAADSSVPLIEEKPTNTSLVMQDFEAAEPSILQTAAPGGIVIVVTGLLAAAAYRKIMVR